MRAIGRAWQRTDSICHSGWRALGRISRCESEGYLRCQASLSKFMAV